MAHSFLVKLDTTTPNQQFKVGIINGYIGKIDMDLYRETVVCRRYKKWLGFCYWVNVASSTMSVVMASGSLAALTNMITSPIAIPFTCIVAVSGMITLITNLVGNKLQHKLKKHRAFVSLMEAYQLKLREQIVDALTDDLVSNEELKTITNIIIAYEKEKSHVRSKWRWKINPSSTPPSSTPPSSTPPNSSC